jgi:hypothetical protein
MLRLSFDDIRALLRADWVDYWAPMPALAAPIHCKECGRAWPGNVEQLHRFCPAKQALSYSRDTHRTSRRAQKRRIA